MNINEIILKLNLSKEKIQEINSLEFREINSKIQNKIGTQSGLLTILGLAPKKNNRAYWWAICNCSEHNIIKIRTDAIGNTKSCGCIKKENIRKIGKACKKDLTNQTFNFLTALYELNERDSQGKILWHCKCKCGNEIDVIGTSLTSGNTKSCGCIRKKSANFAKYKSNLIGRRFGYLTVLEETEQRKYGKIIWQCKCDCGRVVLLNTSQLTSGNSISCGCRKDSLGAKYIKELLEKNNIPFKIEYNIKELGNKKFDFALLNNNIVKRFIEFDGEQHYKSTGGWNNEENVNKVQQRDKEKNEWAKQHNIPLVRIPYWERDNITLDMILGDKYLVK